MCCSGSAQARQAALPPDASCEDLQIEVTLPFLNAFVQQALAQGAAPYISQQQRASMGVMPTSRHHEAAEQPHALRFAAYERAQAPGVSQAQHGLLDGAHGQAGQQGGSRSGSPVKGGAAGRLGHVHSCQHIAVSTIGNARNTSAALLICCTYQSLSQLCSGRPYAMRPTTCCLPGL